MPDGSQWLASGTLYSKNMLISGKNRAVASTYFKADATAPFCASFSGEWLGIYLAIIAYRLKKKSLRVGNPQEVKVVSFLFSAGTAGNRG